MATSRKFFLLAVAWCATLLVAWASYSPGLHGTFLFDDFVNLPSLGDTGPINSWPAFWRYVTSGTADPTGRPVALLSFLLDAHDWPADPRPFLRTNLVLHLFNGVLLALLLRGLGHAGQASSESSPRRLRPSALSQPAATSSNVAWQIDLAALLGAAFWLLHPLFVSTTLYIVQREAILPATFTLLGLLLWLHGRSRMQAGSTWSGLAWVALGLGACTLLAVLSKANGVLLPSLALVIEYVWLRNASSRLRGAPTSERDSVGAPLRRDRISQAYRRIMLLFGWLPSLVILGYLLDSAWNGLVHGISAVRPWTLGQRLLTEPRILMDYLGLLWLPRPFTPGLFNDQIVASTSLWSPATTLPSILAVIGLIAGAWLLRKRVPAIALAVLFYFVGQSIESSSIALELYFEHRNYLPALLMFWPLAIWLSGVPLMQSVGRVQTSTRGFAVARIAIAAILLAMLGTMTYARASLWGNPHDQALLWARLNPQSPRAAANAAQTEISAGFPARAVKRLQPMLVTHPDEVQVALNLFAAQCQLGYVDSPTLRASFKALGTMRDPGTLLLHWFERLISQADHPACQQAGLNGINEMIAAALQNKNLSKAPGRLQDLYYLQGRLALLRGNSVSALMYFDRALDQDVRVDAALQQAALLGRAGYPVQGLRHLDYFEAKKYQYHLPRFGMRKIHAWVLERQNYWQNELKRLRKTLQEDVNAQAGKSKTSG
jgi:hypothetical protein